MSACLREHLSLPLGFMRAARRYWLSVYPRVRGEMARWRGRAQLIPDPLLRTLALEMQRAKVGNVEGAAAYAAFGRRDHRDAVVGAQVAFQTAYDYADVLAERGGVDPVANGRALHRALWLVAESAGPHIDYYAHWTICGQIDDGSYLTALSDRCRLAFGTLPSRAALAGPLERAVQRIVAYQGRNHRHPQGTHLALAGWASRQTPPGTGLQWWETAASAGSSTGIFSFIAAASRPHTERAQAGALERAYFPWVGSLHTLLDSLVDRREDAQNGQRSLLDYYGCVEEASRRMGLIAGEAVRNLRGLPDGQAQLLVFAAMASSYLIAVPPDLPSDHAISRAVLTAIGMPVMPSLLVFALRRAISRIRDRTSGAHSSESWSCRGEGASGASVPRGRPRLAQWPITWLLRQLW